MSGDDKTLDPLNDALSGSRSGKGGLGAYLRVLFHSDLRRIGAVAPLGREPVRVVGRLDPLFLDEATGTVEALDDPCVSRSQFTLSRITGSTYALTVDGNARRVTEVRGPDGALRSAGEPLTDGSLICIGDRVILQLKIAGREQGPDRLGMLGESDPLWDLRAKVLGAAGSDGPVLLQGETGVGKELTARAIHQASPRRAASFVVVNCAALPEHLLESELFGHERGAFPGADEPKLGLFRSVQGGTLMLDEVGELPLSVQSKLLRVLQERTVLPLGGLREHAVSPLRVIAATHRDLFHEVQRGAFRADLYYRLAVLTLTVPPLRDRPEDVPLIFSAFFRESVTRYPELARWLHRATQHPPPVPASLFVKLLGHSWPGNVRQLRNLVEKLAVANVASVPFHIPREVSRELQAPAESTPTVPPRPTLADDHAQDQENGRSGAILDEASLVALLDEHDYVQGRAARSVGVSPATINRWMRERGLRRPRDISAEELAKVSAEAGGNISQMARLLRISERGLRLRLTSLHSR